jgi:hypothetical protein
MRLVLKLPQGKPPFIGIEFSKIWQGEKENRDLIFDFKNEIYTLLIEPIGGYLNIRLFSEQKNIVRYYNGVSYNKDAFKRWIELTRNSGLFNFGHTYQENSVDKICIVLKDGIKIYFVLKVNRYMIDD